MRSLSLSIRAFCATLIVLGACDRKPEGEAKKEDTAPTTKRSSGRISDIEALVGEWVSPNSGHKLLIIKTFAGYDVWDSKRGQGALTASKGGGANFRIDFDDEKCLYVIAVAGRSGIDLRLLGGSRCPQGTLVRVVN